MNPTRATKDIMINQLSDKERKWFAVYTKYKCEKYVADHLTKKQIDAYVPIVTTTKRYTKKIKQYQKPLINCYVFVHIQKDQYIPTLETEYVMKFLRQGKDLLAIPQAEIDILKRVAGDIIEAVSIENQLFFEPGEMVEVISGHLTGIKGRIVSRSAKKAFLIELESLGFQLRINIDFKLLKLVKNKSIIS